jgi:6-phosphogluconate dehydrogenase
MQIGFVGLGRMGGNMVHRLRRDSDIDVVAFDPNAEARAAAVSHGATAVASLQELVDGLSSPRSVWMMVPAGEITEKTLDFLLDHLSSGDTVIDGGNTNYKDTVARAERAKDKGIAYIDAGTSGGVWGLEAGYCLMVGGDKDAVERHRRVFETLAPPDGFLHVGPAGAGNYVKMIHNGIEYGMLQAYAEGFAILEAKKDFGDFDLGAIAHLWNQGSVVRSWLLELAERAFADDPQLAKLKGWVDDTGEGRWTVSESIDLAVPAPVLALSLYARFGSRLPDGFGNKVIAALRNQFGGHAVKSEPVQTH